MKYAKGKRTRQTPKENSWESVQRYVCDKEEKREEKCSSENPSLYRQKRKLSRKLRECVLNTVKN